MATQVLRKITPLDNMHFFANVDYHIYLLKVTDN
jgi:hypothetical protein